MTFTQRLFELQDMEYRDFHSKLVPGIDKDYFIGVRTPDLRKLAKDIINAAKTDSKIQSQVEDFIATLPHKYYEENNLHGELLKLIYKKEELLPELIEQVERFLPYVNNWATCDLMTFKVFKKNPDLVYSHILKWINSNQTYTVRYGIVILLSFFLDENFKPEMLEIISSIQSEEYYINMAIAWYFSFALIKQYDATIGYFTTPVMSKWVHNKAIQKSVESNRIDNDTKAYLKTLKL